MPAPVRPNVVALIPAWRASAFIERTLDAWTRQTYQDLEILVSDDASPDDTARLCERYAAGDPRVRVLRQSKNLGWVGNVNALLDAARGDYFVIAGDDDLPEPAYIERLVEALEHHPAAILAFSDVWLVDGTGYRGTWSYTDLDGMGRRVDRVRRLAILDRRWWLPFRGLFRAPAARAIGGLKRHRAGEFSADWPWLIHMALLGEFVHVPECLYVKTSRPGSVSRAWTFSARSWHAVAVSAMREVKRAPVNRWERAQIYGTLMSVMIREYHRVVRRAVSGLRIRLRAPFSSKR